tara:strand:+ start:3338 stop:4024 length:687 start_codon:yes stop_codon:yes gene_type:complete
MESKLLDIFLKRTKKEKKKPKIIIDHREKNSLVWSILISLGVETEFKELKVGDYIVKDVVIERKTVFDFISSMKNKRLVNQLEELQQYKNKLLIIEGIDEQELYSEEYSKEKIGMHPNSVRGFLLSIVLNHKVPIIFTKNQEDTAKFIFILSKREMKEVSLNVSKKSLNKKERKQFIIESFSGIGPKTTKKLLKKFKTIKNIINASQEELKEIIGKKAESFKVVGEKY